MDLDEQLDRRSRLDRIAQALLEINPRDAFVFWLRFYGFKRSEVAEILGVSRPRIQQLETRAVRDVSRKVGASIRRCTWRAQNAFNAS